MTLEIFSRDVVPILTLLIALPGVIGIILVYLQLRIAQKQIQLNNLWNRTQAQHTLLDNLPDEDHEGRFWKLYKKYKDEFGVVSKSSAQEIYSEIDDWVCAKTYMNKFETLCAAINRGYVDFEYAYHVHSAKIVGLYDKWRGFVDFARDRLDDDEIYLELQNVHTKFQRRYIATREQREAKIEELDKQRHEQIEALKSERGAKPHEMLKGE